MIFFHVHFQLSYTSITTRLVYMYIHDSEQLIAVNTDTLSTSDVDAKQMLSIRTFGDNFAHARVKGHDFENGEYLNSK